MEKFNERLEILKRLSRELNIFKQEHKIFKEKFIFSDQDQYNEVPLAIEEMNLYLAEFKTYNFINDAVLPPKSCMKPSNSSAQLKPEKSKAFLETFKLFEEDKSNYTESKNFT